MPSATKTAGPTLLKFPQTPSGDSLKLSKEIVRQHAAEIRGVCRETSMALLELRSGIVNRLLDLLDKLDLDRWTLVNLLDERPSVVQDLMAGDVEELTTETMIRYLERLLSV